MEFSRPRLSILSLFDPLSLTPELDRTTSPDSDKENDLTETSFFHPSGTNNHIHAPPRTLKRRLVDVGDTTVEIPDMHTLLSDELEQELSYIVNDYDDENDTLTFRDMAKAATPKWSSHNTTALETPKASPPRTPLAEISLKDDLTALARKKLYKRQPIATSSKGSLSACLISPPFTSSYRSSHCHPSYAEVPEVRVNDEPVPQGSPVPANSLENLSESLCSHALNQSTHAETLIAGPSIPDARLPSSLVVPGAQIRTRHLSPTSPTANVNRHSIDLQSSFQIHFPSHDTTFDLLNDKISFFGSRTESDSFFNNLEGDSGLDDDISIPGPGFKIESNSEVSSTITLDQAQSVVNKLLIEHPTPVPNDIDVTEPSKANPSNADALTLVQPPASNQINAMPPLAADTSVKATFVQPHAFQTPSNSHPLPLVTNNSCPLSTPSSLVDNPRHPPPQIPALRIVKRSKTITQQKPSITTRDGPQQNALIPVGSRVPVTETPASFSLATITKKGHPSEISQVRRLDKVPLPSSLTNGPRRVLISEGPKLNSAPNVRAAANLEQVKPSGPRRVAVAVPPISSSERASSSTRPLVQPSSGLRQPVNYGTSGVKPIQRTAGSRLPAITRRIGVSSGADLNGMPQRVT